MLVKYTCEYEVVYEIPDEKWDECDDVLLSLTESACHTSRLFLGKRPHYLKDFRMKVLSLESHGEVEG